MTKKKKEKPLKNKATDGCTMCGSGSYNGNGCGGTYESCNQYTCCPNNPRTGQSCWSNKGC